MKINVSFVSDGVDYSVTAYGDKKALTLLSSAVQDSYLISFLRFVEDKKVEGDDELMPQPKLGADVPF